MMPLLPLLVLHLGYVSSGIKTGNWGWKSVQSGLIGAAAFEIGYLSGGTAATAEFYAGAFGNSAAYSVMGNYIAGSAVSSLAGQFLPSVPLIQSKNFNLSLSPSFAVGSGGWSAGVNASATASIGNVDIGVAAGVSYGHSNITGVTESSSYISGRAGAHIGNLHYGLQSTQFGGSFSQRVGGLMLDIRTLICNMKMTGLQILYLQVMEEINTEQWEHVFPGEIIA